MQNKTLQVTYLLTKGENILSLAIPIGLHESFEGKIGSCLELQRGKLIEIST
jgi:hypothetical protein